MDCFFPSCLVKDQIVTAMEKMAQFQSNFIIVVDNKNIYQGIIPAAALLGCSMGQGQLVEKFVQEIEPVQDNDDITTLKKVSSDIVPVINPDRSVSGVVSLKSLIEYLPDFLQTSERQYAGGTRKNEQLNSKYTIDDIIGQSREILTLKERIIAAAKTKSTVLIMGETGTGKELVAHAIHRLSDRRHQPFVRINCAAIPENLLESELFGYEAGAFTGAVRGGHPGKFEVANGGTIFLDEIGDMPLSLQAKILRIIQEREIEKIGARMPLPIDVRIIAATQCNLVELVKSGKFRQDLYYRLHVIPIHMPALRNHLQDIPLLVEYFLEKYTAELGVERPVAERDFLRALLAYQWPGNVRELANILEMVVAMSHGTITREHLPDYILFGEGVTDNQEENSHLRSYAGEAERDAILKAMRLCGGNKIKVAEALGISRSSLYNKMKRYNIEG